MDHSLKGLSTSLKHEKLSPEDFTFGLYLGMGGYGKVYQARKRSGKDSGTICAMKIMKKTNIVKSKKKIENVKSERTFLEALKHPFIVSLLYAFETEDSFYLGLEYMRNGDLFSYLEKEHFLSEHQARLYAAEVILALKYLHENSIVYRDLKPDNILLDAEGHVKLSDFGLCKRLCPVKNRAYTFCGTLDYMSPEMVQKRVYTKAVDWWSVGVLLFDMLTGCPPFTILNDRQMTMQNIKYGKFSFHISSVPITFEAKDLICKLLKIYPTERLGSGQTGSKEIMSHPFFKSINWDDVLARKFEPFITTVDENTNFIERKVKIFDPEDTIALADSDKNIFEDFDYVSPTLLSDTFVTYARISQECRPENHTYIDDKKKILLINEASQGA